MRARAAHPRAVSVPPAAPYALRLVAPAPVLSHGAGRRPLLEERVFLFVDLVGSTPFAEREGEQRVRDYLSAFLADLAGPVETHGGAIDDFVGDLAFITWPLVAGTRDAACIRCVFAILDALAHNATSWRARFGTAPRIRATLHAGPVVVDELPLRWRKRTYFGATVNTTARLEALTKTLNVPILASVDLLDRVGRLPEGVLGVPLGNYALRGRPGTIAVSALARRCDRGAPPSAIDLG